MNFEYPDSDFYVPDIPPLTTLMTVATTTCVIGAICLTLRVITWL